MTLEFTDAAVADLQSIRSFTFERCGAEQESRYVNALWDKFQEILACPAKWRSRDDLFPGCQIASQGRHVILFRAQEESLQIVRIFHSAMDFRRHLRG